MEFTGFTSKQKKVIGKLQKYPYSILTGAVRSGKTVGLEFGCIPLLKEHWQNNTVFIGKTVNTIDRNMFLDMRSLYGNDNVSQIYGANKINIFGKECFVIGANDERAITKIQGMSIGLAISDEMTTHPENFFNMLLSRLDKHNSRLIGSCNPEGPSHYIKRFIDNPNLKDKIFSETFNIFDNPKLPKDYVETLIKAYQGTVYYDRWVEGKWSVAEGLVFPCFNREKHFMPLTTFTNRYGNKNIVAVIFGTDGATTNDATAIVPLAIMDDGTAAVLEIFYHDPKVNIPLSNEQLMPLVAQYLNVLENKYCFSKHGVKLSMPVDCASSDLALTLFYHFPRYNPFAFTRKNIIDTTQTVNSALGRNIITVFDYGGMHNYYTKRFEPNVPNRLVFELESMVWDVKRENKFNDTIPNDVADAFRYAVGTFYFNPHNLWRTPEPFKTVA